MIVSFQPGHQNWDDYIVCPRKPLTVEGLRERMLQRAKVTEGSYAFQLIDDLHESIFVRSLNVKADYETYFAIEYASFDEYLRRRVRFPSSIAATLAAAFEDSMGMYYFRPDYASLYGIVSVDLLTRLVDDLPMREGL